MGDAMGVFHKIDTPWCTCVLVLLLKVRLACFGPANAALTSLLGQYLAVSVHEVCVYFIWSDLEKYTAERATIIIDYFIDWPSRQVDSSGATLFEQRLGCLVLRAED